MADTDARINLLTDLKATIEGATEDGTPGIATDYAHRLGWLSGGSFRWGALRGAAEEFASVKPLNIPTGYLVRTNATTGIMEASNLTDTGTAVSCNAALSVAGGKTTLAASVAGYASLNFPNGVAVTAPIAGDMWAEDPHMFLQQRYFSTCGGGFGYFTQAKSPRWLAYLSTAESAGNVGNDITFACYDNTGVLIDNPLKVYRTGTVESTRQFASVKSASDTVGNGSGVGLYDSSTPTKAWISQLGASNTLDFWNYSGSWFRKIQFSSAGGITCRTSEPVVSGLTASTSGLSYSNSTTTTSIIAAGAKTIAAGRWGVAGTIWTALAMGTIQWTNAHTLRIQVKLGATVIADSGAISMSAIASGSIWSLTMYGTLRTVGASGTLQIDGVFRCTEAGGLVAIKGFPVSTASPAAIDTTIANTFDVVVTAGTASASNILATRTFHLSGV